MSFLSEIKSRLGPLIDELPKAQEFEWVDYPHASPPKALVLGYEKGKPILAFLQFRDSLKNLTLRYHIDEEPFDRGDIFQMNLVSTFKYFKTHKSQNSLQSRSFSLLIKYYLCVMGAGLDGFTSVDEYIKGLNGALQLIREGKLKEQGGRGIDTESDSDLDEEDSGKKYELDVPASYYNYEPVIRLLFENNEMHLLDNIYTVRDVKFFDQTAVPSALPKALFIGKTREKDDIYAFISFNEEKATRIEFLFTNPKGTLRAIHPSSLTLHVLHHPFNKTYSREAISLRQEDELRLKSLITWYFVTKGLVDSNSFHEIKDNPSRFRSCLSYIAKCMGPGAVKPKPSQISADQRNISLVTQRKETVDTGRKVSLVTATQGLPKEVVARPTPAPSREEMSNNRGRARETEMAQLDEAEKTLRKDRELTKRINAYDELIDDLDLRKQALLRKRNAVEEKRKKVKRRFLRQSKALTSIIADEDEHDDEDDSDADDDHGQ